VLRRGGGADDPRGGLARPQEPGREAALHAASRRDAGREGEADFVVADPLALLEEHVSAWLREAEAAPYDIALLTAKARERSAVWQVDRLGGAVLTDDPWDTGGILRCSIHRFKGLERLVVACCELEQARDAVPYVGFSRAKVFLSVYATPQVARSLPIARPG